MLGMLWVFWKCLIRNLDSTCLEGLGKITKTSIRIASVLAEIHTKHLLNTSLEHYCYTNLLSCEGIGYSLLQGTILA
jgi:hypothetical protein